MAAQAPGLMTGRRMIYTSEERITLDNVREVVENAMDTHRTNSGEIKYLYNYYRGDQPILGRTKKVRPEICNRIVVNVANEIVSFKVGYLCGEPVQYINRTTDEKKSDAVLALNNLMTDACKINHDQEIVQWQMICGTAYRMVLPDKESDMPFELYTLDPRSTFVVYSDRIGNKPMIAVHYRTDDNDVVTYSCYTRTDFYEWSDNGEIRHEEHALGMIPVFEYPANKARLGAFETVLTQLDAINNVQSNRMDGIEQFVQAFMKFINCDIDEDGWEKFREQGLIKIRSANGQNADVDMVSNQLDQSQIQTMRDDLYSAVLTICAMPNRHKNSSQASTSDTGMAVELRDGWSAAETSAKDSENMFKRSEREMLRLITKLCRELAGIDLDPSDVDIKFTRRNFEGIQAKSQVLTTMLDKPQIHPLLAFTACGLFTDPETAYKMSEKWHEEYQRKEIERQKTEAQIAARASPAIADDGNFGKTEK